MMPRLSLCLLLLLTARAGLRADTTLAPGEWDSVTVAPGKTSIYVGTVTLAPGEFRREGDHYVATYEAKVWPWFFWSETGRISIALAPEGIQRLLRGERVEFTGEAHNQKNKPRRVTGWAERTDAATGKIKVRIGVDDTMLVFNTGYRFNQAVK